MGILDEAIREHLDLKRRHGAAESELKQLEDEAFGPPARPGEPDFPEGAEASEGSGNGTAAETTVAPAPEPMGDEPPAAEHPVLEGGMGEADPVPEPAVEPEERAAFYDQDSEAGPKAEDLEPDVPDEEPVPPEPAAADQAGLEEAPETAAEEPEPPIESLDTVEHAFPEEEVEPEAPLPPEERPAPEEPAEPADVGERPEEEAGEDDVLADTPEFLKDAPEDDELWFEQGQPKDFDF